MLKIFFFTIFFILEYNISNCVILTPPYFNLVTNKKVTATATCGEDINEPEFYCKLTGSTATDRETSNYANLIQGQYCYYCDPRDPTRTHHANYSIDGSERWWQSPPLSRSLDYNMVNLTIDLGQTFHVAYIYIKMANSPRPGVWALEKSNDFGQTFTPWQYFADTPSDCYSFFGIQPTKSIRSDDQVICTTEYSKVLPVEGGEILLSLVNNRPNSKNFTHSDVLQNWTRATNVRLRLMRTKNLLGHLMAVAKQDPTVTRRYFYSIRDVSIGGRCVCNGHAQQCDAASEMPNKLICRCSHNTCGDQCEQCCPGFMQKKWQQNRENKEFECEPCQCYGHSDECVYDPETEEKRLSIDIHGNYQGGGVCQNCDHNTEGINCEKCQLGYYRPFGVPINSTNACRKCECDNKYSTGNCAQTTGQCECKPQYSGPTCEKCTEGFTDWPLCKPCICNNNGSSGGCFPPCRCNFGFLGPFCDKCVDGYYGFPNCRHCQCDRVGTSDLNCDQLTGQCVCRSGYSGFQCDQCDNGYYRPSLAISNGNMCRLCKCDLTGTVDSICHKNNGTCICKANFAGEECNQCAPGFYNFPNCLPCSCDPEGSIDQNCRSVGDIQQCMCIEGRGGPTCNQCAPGFFKYPICEECQCDEAGSIGQSCDQLTGKCTCKANFINHKCSECAPNLFNYPYCEECRCHPDGTSPSFPGCNKNLKNLKGIVCPCREHVTGRQCDQCKDRYYGLTKTNLDGCSLCQCNRDGSLNELELCEQNSGQCYCKQFVNALECNDCKSGSFNLQRNNIFGCESCDCQVGSSVDNNCDKSTGKCECLSNIIGQKCDQPADGFYFPDMHQLKFELEDGYSSSKNKKQVRYDFDEIVFPDYSWKGYVHLNRIIGEVAQDIVIREPGTYRMIVKYVSNNTNISELFVRVRPVGKGDEQNATVYLSPSMIPKFETVTVNQISALTLELESSNYIISFQNKMEKLYIDYFVLLPSNYFESTGLELNLEKACTDYRNEEICLQYRLVSLDSYSPKVIYEPNSQIDLQQTIDLDSIKEFNHSYAKPVLATRLGEGNSFTKEIKFPSATKNYTLLIDFLNLNDDGKEITVDVIYPDLTVKTGKVFLYKCNYTNLCRQVLLSNEFNIPLLIEGSSGSAIFKFRSSDSDVLVYQVTLVPKEKFHINHLKMAPHCIIKDKKCSSLEYTTISGIKTDLDETNERQSNEPYRYIPAHKSSNSYIPTSKNIYLYDHLPELTVPLVQRRDSSEQVIIVHYYQPNHPTVNVSINIDNVNKGSIQAEYCPSISGCRAIVTFESSGESFTNPDARQITFQLTQNGKDIWIDYILLASSTHVSVESLHKFIPIDLTSDFIAKCASQHFSIEYNKSEFCDKSVVSLSAKYNGGAQACQCDLEGSELSYTCEKFGGQCACKENVIGRQCTKCRSGYFGFPNCQKCNCPSGNCDDVTGQCICPPNVEEGSCTVCVDNTFGFHPKFGCEECNCEVGSTINGSRYCDKNDGQCQCKSNTDGQRCDRCKNGFYSYPECYECQCNKNGTIDQICDPITAACQCKENVYGSQCEYCSDGTFNLEQRNSKGCTKCFCFGLTNRCESASYLYLKRLKGSLSDWKLDIGTNNDLLESVKVVNSNSIQSEGVELQIPDELKKSDADKLAEPLYWKAPELFTGNKIASYGGSISYKIRINTPLNSIGVIRPDLILVGQNITLVHTSFSQPANQVLFENNIDLIEYRFSHLISGSSATREHLMIVLSSLKEIKLRTTYYNRVHESELIDFEMDHAVEDAVSNQKAMSAERCDCPPNYAGLSCESCIEGYHKTKSNGPGLFSCVQCQCNGHADTCDQETGVCLNCQGNTEGNSCEKCKKGYHMVELGYGRFECRICPCPGPTESNVFADSCMFDSNSNNVYFCQCLKGYTGQYCERCASGYYGDPTAPGGKCLPCNCNNNIDMNDIDSCDQRTGECKKCLNNTAGPQCSECAYWHYGDPIIRKNCQKCECNECGSETCDPQNGDCKCKKNVRGYNCDTCGANQWGFNQCNGCYDCECDPIGSKSTHCDIKTGKCECKPGVTGRTCDKCLPDHWNFTEVGCQQCNCKLAGAETTATGGYSCNSTNGQCTCIAGVTGPNCDKCKPRWVLVDHIGCVQCDTCIDTLLDDLEILFIKVDGIENGNKNSSLTFKAHNKLVKLEYEFKKISDSTDPNNYGSTPLILLQKKIDDYQRKILPEFQATLALPLADKLKAIKTLLNDAEEFNIEINSLRSKFDALDVILNQLDKSSLDSIRVVTEEELNVYEKMVDDIMKKNFNTTIDEYRDVLLSFEETNKTVQNLASNFAEQMNKIDEIKEQNLYVQKSLVELKSLIFKAKSVENFNDKDVTFRAYFDNLEQIKNETNNLQQLSASTLEQVENIVKEAYKTLEASNGNLADLDKKVNELQNVYENHDTRFVDLRKKCSQAEQKASEITRLGQNWQNKVLRLQDGLAAFEMAQIYEKIANNYNEAYNKSNDILNTYKANEDKLKNLLQSTESAKNKSSLLLDNCETESKRKSQAEKDYEKMNREYTELEQRSKVIDKTLTRIDQWINKTMNSDALLINLKTELDSQQTDLKKHEEESVDLIRRIQSLDSLRTSLPRPEDGDESPTGGDNLIKYIDDTINSLNSSTPKLHQSVLKLQQDSNFNSELDQIRNDIYELKLLLASARDIANEIKVAVNFTDSTVIQLKPSPDLKPSLITSGSIFVQTREFFAPIAFIYNESNPLEYVSIYLEQGRPHFQYRLSDREDATVSKLATKLPINDGQWHKIEFERIGKAARLTVLSDYDRKQEVLQESKDNSVIFNIDPNGAKIMLGQFPITNTPSELRTVAAYNNQFRGAIDDVKLNGHSYGLWNFDSANNIKGEPKRLIKSYEETADSDNDKAVQFMEDSFLCLSQKNSGIKLNAKYPLEVTIHFKTDTPNGLLWLWSNDEKQYIAIYLESGHVNVALVLSSDEKLTLFEKYSDSQTRMDDNKFHKIYTKISVRKSTDGTNMQELEIVVREIIGSELSVIGEVTHKLNRKPFVRNGQQCIGGIQAIKKEGIFKDAHFASFIGCISSVLIPAIDAKPFNLPEMVLSSTDIQSSNVAPKCPGEADQCKFKATSNSEHVYLQFELAKYVEEKADEETIGISFVTANPDGILFYRTESRRGNTNSIILQLKERRLSLTYYEGDSSFTIPSIDNKKQYSDNKLHIVYLIKRRSVILLRVDDELVASSGNTLEDEDEYSNVPITSNALYVAGIPESQRALLNEESFSNFEGCITQVLYNNNEIKFNEAINAKSSNGISFAKCYRVPIRSALLNIPGYKQLQSLIINLKQTNKQTQQIQPIPQQEEESNDSKQPIKETDECSLSKQYDTSQLKSVGLRFGLSKRSRLEVHDSFAIKITTFVSFKFRTLQSEGLMLYASDAQYSDFISIWLQDGYVNYAFDCGSGFMHLKSKRTYSDGRYHTVSVMRDKQQGVLLLADRTNSTVVERIEDKSPGEASSLSLMEPFYFGSLPENDRNSLPPGQSDLIMTEPFVGCMSDFNIAFKSLRNKLQRIDLMNCSNNHESGLFFTGLSLTSHANLLNYLTLKDSFEIGFEIKSRTKNGVVLFIGTKEAVKDYILLEMIDGELNYKWNVDGIDNIVKFVPQLTRNELCNSSWIRIKLRKEERGVIMLEIKGNQFSNSFNQEVTVGKELVSLFLGALPIRSTYAEISQTNEPFIGCIRDLSIRKNSGVFANNKALLEMNLEDGVLNYCPLK